MQIKMLKSALCFVIKSFCFLSGFNTRTDKSRCSGQTAANASVTEQICRSLAGCGIEIMGGS